MMGLIFIKSAINHLKSAKIELKVEFVQNPENGVFGSKSAIIASNEPKIGDIGPYKACLGHYLSIFVLDLHF